MPDPPFKPAPPFTDLRAPDPPAWARKEFAWPLSLLIGFAASWLGLQIPIPGLAALLAAGAIAPLYFQFQDRGELSFATFIATGWLIGSGAAGAGMAIEGDLPRVLAALPQGRLASEHWIEPWLDVRSSLDPPRPGWVPYALVAGFPIVGLCLAPLGRGVFLLLWIGLGLGALTGVSAVYADAAARSGLTPLSAWAWGWPPLACVALVATLAAGGALAGPPGRVHGADRRNALLVGTPVALGAGLLQIWWLGPWARWATDRLVG